LEAVLVSQVFSAELSRVSEAETLQILNNFGRRFHDRDEFDHAAQRRQPGRGRERKFDRVNEVALSELA
jgi:hypothetical protein